jgi:hypothetical protein
VGEGAILPPSTVTRLCALLGRVVDCTLGPACGDVPRLWLPLPTTGPRPDLSRWGFDAYLREQGACWSHCWCCQWLLFMLLLLLPRLLLLLFLLPVLMLSLPSRRCFPLPLLLVLQQLLMMLLCLLPLLLLLLLPALS